jgi:hypothetical protein
MMRSKSLTTMMIAVFILSMAMIDLAFAVEKIKTSATSIRTKWHSIEVGNEGGHTIALYENKQVYAEDTNGLTSTGVN